MLLVKGTQAEAGGGRDISRTAVFMVQFPAFCAQRRGRRARAGRGGRIRLGDCQADDYALCPAAVVRLRFAFQGTGFVPARPVNTDSCDVAAFRRYRHRRTVEPDAHVPAHTHSHHFRGKQRPHPRHRIHPEVGTERNTVRSHRFATCLQPPALPRTRKGVSSPTRQDVQDAVVRDRGTCRRVSRGHRSPARFVKLALTFRSQSPMQNRRRSAFPIRVPPLMRMAAARW